MSDLTFLEKAFRQMDIITSRGCCKKKRQEIANLFLLEIIDRLDISTNSIDTPILSVEKYIRLKKYIPNIQKQKFLKIIKNLKGE